MTRQPNGSLRHRAQATANLPRLVALALALSVGIPVGLTLLASLDRSLFDGVAGGMTLHWLALALDECARPLLLSLLLALGCLALTLLLGVPCAYGLTRLKGRLPRLIEQLLVLPLAMPGLVLAMAMTQSYTSWQGFRQSPLFILSGHVLVTLPLMVASVRGVLAMEDPLAREEAAASLGAGFCQRFRDVVLPACRPGMVSGGVQVVTLSIGEFNLTWLLRMPGDPTLPTALADAYATSRLELASACTVIFFLTILPLLLLVHRLSRRGVAARGMGA